jgi:hypothetical protein
MTAGDGGVDGGGKVGGTVAEVALAVRLKVVVMLSEAFSM